MPNAQAIDMNRIVYIKEIKFSDLPQSLMEIIPDNAKPYENQLLYVVCSADGVPMSILDDRATAFTSARQFNLEPQSVH